MMEEVINLPDLEMRSPINSSLVAGKTGKGKTNSGMVELEGVFLFKKYKCIDVDNSGRFENVTYGLAEDDPNLIQCYADFPDMEEHWKLKPMGFLNKVYLLCGRHLQSYDSLPKNMKVVSLKLEDLNISHVKQVLGGTESLMATLNLIQAKFGLDTNIQDVWDILFKYTFRGRSITPMKIDPKQRIMIKVRIQSLMQTGLFSDKCEKLDFEEFFNDASFISCVNSNLQYTAEERQLAYTIIFDKALEFMINRRVKHRIHLFVREIFDFKEWSNCMASLGQFMRKGRVLGKFGIDICVDTQRLKDLPPNIRRQPYFHQQFGGDLEDGKALAEVRWIPPVDLQRVTGFSVGKCMIVTDSRYDVPIEVPPCRHKQMSRHEDTLAVLGECYGVEEWSVERVEELLKYEDDSEIAAAVKSDKEKLEEDDDDDVF